MTDGADVSSLRAIPSKRIARDVVILLVLLAAHETLKRVLADGAIVAALFSPGGAHSVLTLLVALLLVVVRLTLFIGVPGFLGASAVSWVRRVYDARTRA